MIVMSVWICMFSNVLFSLVVTERRGSEVKDLSFRLSSNHPAGAGGFINHPVWLEGFQMELILKKHGDGNLGVLNVSFYGFPETNFCKWHTHFGGRDFT